MSCDFSTTTHGKWILAGEHSVLRGGQAICFPVLGKTLTLQYEQRPQALTAQFAGQFATDTHLLFWSVLERGCELLGKPIASLSGHCNVINNIPVGAGLGTSAALAAALTQWFIWQQLIPASQLYRFARRLEDLCHGQSSGVDIAGALATCNGILFQTDSAATELHCHWKPHWYLTPTHQLGVTAHCVKQVNDLQASDPAKAAVLDEQMQTSVSLAVTALQSPKTEGLAQLAEAIKLARDCFIGWGLAKGKVQQVMRQLSAAGALAVKPTGSGDGGFILSLWERPVADTELELIAV